MADDIQLVGTGKPEAQKQQKAVWPVGTLDELKEHGLDPWEYPSCAQRNQAAGVWGCPLWDRCQLHGIKGVSGPERFGLRILKPEEMGGNVRHVAMDCYGAVQLATNAEANKRGEIVEVIAREGESISIIGSEPMKNALGQVTGYEDVEKPEVVLPFRRIKDNKALIKAAMAGAIRKQHDEKKRAAALESRLAGVNATGGLAGVEPKSNKPDRSK